MCSSASSLFWMWQVKVGSNYVVKEHDPKALLVWMSNCGSVFNISKPHTIPVYLGTHS